MNICSQCAKDKHHPGIRLLCSCPCGAQQKKRTKRAPRPKPTQPKPVQSTQPDPAAQLTALLERIRQRIAALPPHEESKLVPQGLMVILESHNSTGIPVRHSSYWGRR